MDSKRRKTLGSSKSSTSNSVVGEKRKYFSFSEPTSILSSIQASSIDLPGPPLKSRKVENKDERVMRDRHVQDESEKQEAPER